MQIVLAQLCDLALAFRSFSIGRTLRLNHKIDKRGKKNEKVLNRRTIEQGTEEQRTV
jgi:hypothetical protein